MAQVLPSLGAIPAVDLFDKPIFHAAQDRKWIPEETRPTGLQSVQYFRTV
jgi:hypothetical protein